MEPYTNLYEYLKNTNLLSEIELEQICSSFNLENHSKNKFYLKAGKRCAKIGFLSSGILCSFIYDTEGYEIVKHFLEPCQLFTDLDSYLQAKPAKLNILAVTDSVVLSIGKQENDILQKKIPKWEHAQSLMASQGLNRMIQMQNFLHFGSAAEKYQHLVREHPNIARHVPLKYIASYLGITQSSLSRLRRESFQ